MKTSARRLSTTPFALAATVLTALLVLCAPLSASAHDALTASSPDADSTVDTLPAALTLTFSATLMDGEGSTEVVVTDAAGTPVTDGAATVNGATVTQPLVAEGEAGAYHVIWKVVSSDGHPTSGEYSFTVATSTLVAPAVEPTTAATEEALPSHAPQTSNASTVPEDPNTDAGLSISPFWMITMAVLLLSIAAVVIMLLSRRGNRRSADSDAIG